MKRSSLLLFLLIFPIFLSFIVGNPQVHASTPVSYVSTVSASKAGSLSPSTVLLNLTGLKIGQSIFVLIGDSNKVLAAKDNMIISSALAGFTYNRVFYGITGTVSGYPVYIYFAKVTSVGNEMVNITDTGNSGTAGDILASASVYSGDVSLGASGYVGNTCANGNGCSSDPGGVGLSQIVFGGMISTNGVTITTGTVRDTRVYAGNYSLVTVDNLAGNNIVGITSNAGKWGEAALEIDPSGIALNGTVATTNNVAFQANLTITTTVLPTLILVSAMIDNTGWCTTTTNTWDCTVKFVQDSLADKYQNVTIANQDLSAGCQQFLFYGIDNVIGTLTVNLKSTKPTSVLGSVQVFALSGVDFQNIFDGDVVDFYHYPINKPIPNTPPLGGTPAYFYTEPPISKNEASDTNYVLTVSTAQIKNEMLLGFNTFGCNQLSGGVNASPGSTKVATFLANSQIFTVYKILKGPYTTSIGASWTSNGNSGYQAVAVAINGGSLLVQTQVLNGAFVLASFLSIIVIVTWIVHNDEWTNKEKLRTTIFATIAIAAVTILGFVIQA